MPFVTEELFHRLCLLAGEARSSILLASYPTPGSLSTLRSPRAEEAMDIVLKVSGSIRTLRSAYLKGPLEKHAPVTYLVCRNPSVAAVLSTQSETVRALARSSKSPPPAALHLVPDG